MIIRQNQPSGFSLMEISVVLGIMGIGVMIVGAFSTGIFRYNRTFTNQIDAEIQLRKVVAKVTAALRTASVSSLGAYPIDTATPGTLVFYANIDSDSFKERVRYFLDNGVFKEGVVKPSGSPLTYNLANEQIVSLADGVINSDIFAYYDETFNGSSPPLSFPVSVSAVRLVHFKLTVDRNLNESPGPATVETNAHLRNL